MFELSYSCQTYLYFAVYCTCIYIHVFDFVNFSLLNDIPIRMMYGATRQTKKCIGNITGNSVMDQICWNQESFLFFSVFAVLIKYWYRIDLHMYRNLTRVV